MTNRTRLQDAHVFKNILIGADFSGIEARVTAWLAGEERKLQVFRDYDAGKGPDPYIVTAAGIYGVPTDKITKAQRQIGKGAELAFGFQGGVNAYKKFVTEGDFTDEQIDDIKNKWRRMHPNIVNFWYALHRAAKQIAIKANHIKHGSSETIEAIQVKGLTFEYEEGFMFIVLPSGRRLSYPFIGRMERPREAFFIQKPLDRPGGNLDSYFMDNSSGRWNRTFLYGGLICENVVQAVARDLLAQAMLRIEKFDLPIVLHVHDEVVIEVPEKHAAEIERALAKLMMWLPAWARADENLNIPKLPLMVKTWRSYRYIK